jgi:hypothetical protein
MRTVMQVIFIIFVVVEAALVIYTFDNRRHRD